nr:hypothetical protein CFP56_52480 [Quercus suber]
MSSSEPTSNPGANGTRRPCPVHGHRTVTSTRASPNPHNDIDDNTTRPQPPASPAWNSDHDPASDARPPTAQEIDAFRRYAEKLIAYCLSRAGYTAAEADGCDVDIAALRQLATHGLFALLCASTRTTWYGAALAHLLRFRRAARWEAAERAATAGRARLVLYERELVGLEAPALLAQESESETMLAQWRSVRAEVEALKEKVREGYAGVEVVDVEIRWLEEGEEGVDGEGGATGRPWRGL